MSFPSPCRPPLGPTSDQPGWLVGRDEQSGSQGAPRPVQLPPTHHPACALTAHSLFSAQQSTQMPRQESHQVLLLQTSRSCSAMIFKASSVSWNVSKKKYQFIYLGTKPLV